METATKNKRGRPRIFNDPKSLYYDRFEHGCIYSDRTLTNGIYEYEGMELIYKIFDFMDGEGDEVIDIFTDHVRHFKQGVLQQLGRMTKENFTEEELEEAAKLAVNLLQEGTKSKEVEAQLRKIRIDHKERGLAHGSSSNNKP